MRSARGAEESFFELVAVLRPAAIYFMAPDQHPAAFAFANGVEPRQPWSWPVG